MAWFTRTIGASTAALCLAGATVGPASAGPPTWDPATDPHCKIETYVVPTAKSTSRGAPFRGKTYFQMLTLLGPLLPLQNCRLRHGQTFRASRSTLLTNTRSIAATLGDRRGKRRERAEHAECVIRCSCLNH